MIAVGDVVTVKPLFRECLFIGIVIELEDGFRTRYAKVIVDDCSVYTFSELRIRKVNDDWIVVHT